MQFSKEDIENINKLRDSLTETTKQFLTENKQNNNAVHICVAASTELHMKNLRGLFGCKLLRKEDVTKFSEEIFDAYKRSLIEWVNENVQDKN